MKARLITGHHGVQLAIKLAEEGRITLLDCGRLKSKTLEGKVPIIDERAINTVLNQFKCAKEFNHQGCYAVFNQEVPSINELDPDQGPVLILGHLEDVSNLGNILRTAAFFGVQGVILPTHRSVSLTPAVERIACGGSLLVPVIEVANTRTAMSTLKKQGFWITGLCETGQSPSKVFEDKRVAYGIVIGNEGEGLSLHERKDCDYLVRLNPQGEFSTLNAATTVAVVLTCYSGA